MSFSEPLARIALRGFFPREIIRLLSSLRLDPFGVSGLDADIVAAFAGEKDKGWQLRFRSSNNWANADAGFHCANAYVGASVLLSRALGLDTLFLAASESSYALVRAAIDLAATPQNILIEGETGTGKRSLAELIGRASAKRAEITRIDCAVGTDLERLADTRLRDKLHAPQGEVVLLDHLAELPRDRQEVVAAAIGDGMVRVLATSQIAIVRMVETGTFAPTLQRQFGATLAIPPLSRRRTDLEVLARHFLQGANPSLRLDSSALAALREYRFAGNVRELQNLMVRVAICEDEGGSARTVTRVLLESHIAGLSPPIASRPEAPAYAPASASRRLRLVPLGEGARPRHRHRADAPHHPGLRLLLKGH